MSSEFESQNHLLSSETVKKVRPEQVEILGSDAQAQSDQHQNPFSGRVKVIRLGGMPGLFSVFGFLILFPILFLLFLILLIPALFLGAGVFKILTRFIKIGAKT